MFLAPVLAVIRASGFGIAFSAATLLIGSCSVLPNEGDTLRIKRVEEAVLPMARVALEAEQTETARRLYLRLLDVDPNSVRARMGLGDIAVARQESAEAARWYAAALAHAREPGERHAALLAHGRAALAAGELQAARRSFSRLTSRREAAPTASVAWGLNGLGLIALLEGDVRGAIRLMEQAVLLAPEEKMLADNLSRALDMSSGVVPESSGADQMDGSFTSPPAPALPERQRPAQTEIPPAAVPVQDRTVPPPAPRTDAVREAGERDETQPAPSVPQLDRSELRPHAIKVGGEYFVRIGVYALEPAAQGLASELRHVTAEVVGVTEFGMGAGSNAVRLYRVLIGPIASRAGLDGLVDTLEEMGYGAARVPPSESSRSARAATQEVGRPAQQPEAGPALVEVFLDGDEVDATSATDDQVQPAPATASEEDESMTLTAVAEEAFPTGEVDPGPAPKDVGSSPSEVGSALTLAQQAVPESGGNNLAVKQPVSGAAAAGVSTPVDPGAASLAGNGADEVPQFLQVGAYTVRSTAEALAAEVGSVARAPVRIVEAELANGETMYRVQVGPIGSRRALMSLSETLISRGYGTVRVLSGSDAESAAGSPQPVSPQQLLAPVSPQRRVRAFIVHEDGRRFLQMGAYAVRATADTLASQLRLVTLNPVLVVQAPGNDGKTLHRVRIGPVDADASLSALLDVLRSSYGSGWTLPTIETDQPRTAFIVHEDSKRFLQLGAFAALAAADALAGEVGGRVDGVRVSEVARGGGLIYRVRIGPIESEDSLSALIEVIESLGFVVD